MLKKYTEAASAFEQVKAITNTPQAKIDAEYGCMRSYDALQNEKKAVASAAVLFASAGIDGEIKREAGLIVGRGRQTAGEHKEAAEIFKTLAKDLNRPLDAEAKYRLIASYAAMKKLQDADNEVMSFVDSQSRQQYWLAKSFIVLGDVYVLRKDKNQAKATYESVINGYPDKNDGVVEEAKQRLNKLMK
jgi:TolA-binding protein